MYEKHGETISAQTFLEVLQSDAARVVFTNCTIEGVVDIFSTGLERDEDDRILLKKSLACTGCTFKNIVNFRTVVFQKEIDFRRTLFEADLDFDEAVLYGPCAFREAIFQRRADFHRAMFHKSASFWRARFNNVADFHRVQFRENVVFHEADFHNEVNFRYVLFQGMLDCTGTLFPEMTAFNNAIFLGDANFTAARFVNVAAFRDVQYIPDTLFQAAKAKVDRKQHRPPEFYLDSRYVDEVANPFFQAIRRRSAVHPCLPSSEFRIGAFMAMEFRLWTESWALGILVPFPCVYLCPRVHAASNVDTDLDAKLCTPIPSNDGCV